MEKEFKWSVPDSSVYVSMLASSELPPIEHVYAVPMDARYYETSDGMIGRRRGGLRLRTEGENTVCCLKIDTGSSSNAALKQREEFECNADSIENGLKLLPELTNAPADFCKAIADAGVIELGRTTFSRQAALLNNGECRAELSMDIGVIARNGKTLDICEIELEFKDGDSEAFEKLGALLQEHFALTPEPLSKLARMYSL